MGTAAGGGEGMDDDRIDKILTQYPFFRAWQEGKLSRKLFAQNMDAFKQQFLEDEGLTPEEFQYVVRRETAKGARRHRKWYEFWKYLCH